MYKNASVIFHKPAFKTEKQVHAWMDKHNFGTNYKLKENKSSFRAVLHEISEIEKSRGEFRTKQFNEDISLLLFYFD